MNEERWLAEDSPSERLRFVGRRGERKLRLLCCGCCRRILRLIPDECHSGITTAERFADGLATQQELREAHDAAVTVRDRVRGPSREYRVMVRHAVETVAGATVERYDVSGAEANPERLA